MYWVSVGYRVLCTGYLVTYPQPIHRRLVLNEDMLRDGVMRPKASKRMRDTGRLKKARELPKCRALADERLHLELSCESAFVAMYQGTIPRIYSESGQLHEDYSGAQFNMPCPA